MWSFTLERTTNAPLEMVAARLKDGEGFHRWHPRHRHAVVSVVHEDAFRVEVVHATTGLGFEETGRYRVTRDGEGLVLSYEGRFKGWPVLVLMGWWRISSDKLWERFVGGLQ